MMSFAEADPFRKPRKSWTKRRSSPHHRNRRQLCRLCGPSHLAERRTLITPIAQAAVISKTHDGGSGVTGADRGAGVGTGPDRGAGDGDGRPPPPPPVQQNTGPGTNGGHHSEPEASSRQAHRVWCPRSQPPVTKVLQTLCFELVSLRVGLQDITSAGCEPKTSGAKWRKTRHKKAN